MLTRPFIRERKKRRGTRLLGRAYSRSIRGAHHAPRGVVDPVLYVLADVNRIQTLLLETLEAMGMDGVHEGGVPQKCQRAEENGMTRPGKRAYHHVSCTTTEENLTSTPPKKKRLEETPGAAFSPFPQPLLPTFLEGREVVPRRDPVPRFQAALRKNTKEWERAVCEDVFEMYCQSMNASPSSSSFSLSKPEVLERLVSWAEAATEPNDGPSSRADSSSSLLPPLSSTDRPTGPAPGPSPRLHHFLCKGLWWLQEQEEEEEGHSTSPLWCHLSFLHQGKKKKEWKRVILPPPSASCQVCRRCTCWEYGMAASPSCSSSSLLGVFSTSFGEAFNSSATATDAPVLDGGFPVDRGGRTAAAGGAPSCSSSLEEMSHHERGQQSCGGPSRKEERLVGRERSGSRRDKSRTAGEEDVAARQDASADATHMELIGSLAKEEVETLAQKTKCYEKRMRVACKQIEDFFRCLCMHPVSGRLVGHKYSVREMGREAEKVEKEVEEHAEAPVPPLFPSPKEQPHYTEKEIEGRAKLYAPSPEGETAKEKDPKSTHLKGDTYPPPPPCLSGLAKNYSQRIEMYDALASCQRNVHTSFLTFTEALEVYLEEAMTVLKREEEYWENARKAAVEYEVLKEMEKLFHRFRRILMKVSRSP